MERRYRDDILESDRRIFSALMNYSNLFKDSNQDWIKIKTVERFQDSIAKYSREKINVFESLYEEGYYLTQIGEFELPKINTTEIYPTIQSFVGLC
ncbi:hypothetical protein FCH07_014405 [Klebsiella pneumoniae]|uniref:hypothetical protein n=1 Tax=Klebsiella pneumoniae TaxID=573 RepID=UPI001143D23A|nr:hypothetical protein [Klebsiella pneumoniae]TYY93490.1 hypothetical protein FCH07_014405 [Klebsiella pneumoniae]